MEFKECKSSWLAGGVVLGNVDIANVPIATRKFVTQLICCDIGRQATNEQTLGDRISATGTAVSTPTPTSVAPSITTTAIARVTSVTRLSAVTWPLSGDYEEDQYVFTFFFGMALYLVIFWYFSTPLYWWSPLPMMASMMVVSLIEGLICRVFCTVDD
ncbi:hypothetical protein B5M09_001555 [Aphanomyces astaci]|uniref:Uncharacterized protein n=1 Tax=Aphanomyces astaci TaxID=112090 RepID=A0A3R7X3R6_APHAT|nr:hypothetical protein B5M09_001555 [Aphanomyces astaci]